MKLISLFCLTLLILCVACEKQEYVIEMKPEGDAMRRNLESWVSDDDPTDTSVLGDEQLQRLVKLYGEEKKRQGTDRSKFSGLFTDKMPDDFGGAGSYVHITNNLGAMSVYLERFRGNDDQLKDIEARFAAVDEITDHCIAWFQVELKDQPSLKNIISFLDQEFRRDLKNFSLMIRAFFNAGDESEQAEQEFVLRMIQYGIERDYLNPDDMLRLLPNSLGQEEYTLDLLRRFIAKQMNITSQKEIDKTLGFLASAEQLENSLNVYLASTPAHQKALEEWQEQKKDKPKLEAPKPEEMIEELFGRFIWGANTDWSIFDTADQLNVSLVLPVKPLYTNGEWSEKTLSLSWQAEHVKNEPNFSIPTLAYALWLKVDKDFQVKHFGKVLLDGEDLFYYCQWRNSLTDAEAKQWETFLSTIKPDKDLIKRLKDFSVANESDAGNPFAYPCEELLSALGVKVDAEKDD